MRKVGVPPENLDPLRYQGPKLHLTAVVEANREPQVYDRNYPLFTFWRVAAPVSGTGTEGAIWYLARFADSGDPVFNPGDAVWLQFATGTTGPIINLRTDDGNLVVPDGAGIVDIDGVIVPNATNSQPLFTDGATANTARLELQVGTARTGAPADTNDAGIVSFDDTAFVVDANGYVTLAGGAGPAIDSIDVDFNTAPGTDPVLPTAGGQIRISGNTVTNATNLNAPVASHSRAANAFNIEVQLATAVAPTPADPFDVGLSSFDNTAFAVDGNGFVTLVGGAGPAAQSFGMQFNTAPGTDPVLPTAAGLVTIDGAVVANATNANTPLATHSRAANAFNIEIQVGTEITGAPADTNDAGIVSFDDTAFTVDANGYVELVNPPLNPIANLFDFDDFLGTRDTDVVGGQSKLGWIVTGASIIEWNPSTIADSGHPGVIRFRTAGVQYGTVTGGVNSGVPNDGGGLTLGGGILRVTWIAKIVDLSTAAESYILRIGIGMMAGTTTSPTDGCYFEYNHGVNSGDWQIITRAASTSTTGNTSDTADTNWHKFDVVINAAASSVGFFIDDVEVANSPQTTNIPTATDLALFMQMNKTVSAAAASVVYSDLCVVDYQLTSARY